MNRFFSILCLVLPAVGLFAATAGAQNPLKLFEALQQSQKPGAGAAVENAADDSIPELKLPAPDATDAAAKDDPFDIDEPLKNVEPAENIEELEAPLPSKSKNSQANRSEVQQQTDRQNRQTAPPADSAQALLGATVEKTGEGQLGVNIKSVAEDGPAQAAGMQAGDRLISVAGGTVTSEQDLQDLLKVLAPGDRIELEFVRGLRKSKTVATLSSTGMQPNNEIALSSATRSLPETIAPPSDPRSFDVVPVPADDRFDPRIGNQIPPPKLGVQIIDAVEETGIGLRKRTRSGAAVQSVAPDSPAAIARIPVGALIVGANGRRVEKSADLAGYMATLKPGEEVELTYYDGNRLRRGKVKLPGGVRPAADFQPVPGDDPATDEAARPILKGLGQQIPALRRVDSLLERISPRTDSAGEPAKAATNQDASAEGLGAIREKLRIQQERNRPPAERRGRLPPLFPRAK